MKTEIQLLAESLSASLAKYRPAYIPKNAAIRKTTDAMQAINLACQRRLRAKRKAAGLNSAGKPLTDFGRKWGKLNVRAMFKRMAREQGITEAAARVRYYRNKQIKSNP
jgi:hypothetical protein